MRNTILAAPAILASTGKAQPTCQNITVSVDVSARNAQFPASLTPQTNVEATNFFLELTRQATNFTQEVLEGVCKKNQ